jgi:thiol-disulfide isomerase/thioredoxin
MTPAVDAAAPDFQVTTYDGRKLALADFKGQVVVLNFWATWCGPCKRELPLLEDYHRRQHANGLVILAVATEDSLIDRKGILRYAKSAGFTPESLDQVLGLLIAETPDSPLTVGRQLHAGEGQ